MGGSSMRAVTMGQRGPKEIVETSSQTLWRPTPGLTVTRVGVAVRITGNIQSAVAHTPTFRTLIDLPAWAVPLQETEIQVPVGAGLIYRMQVTSAVLRGRTAEGNLPAGTLIPIDLAYETNAH